MLSILTTIVYFNLLAFSNPDLKRDLLYCSKWRKIIPMTLTLIGHSLSPFGVTRIQIYMRMASFCKLYTALYTLGYFASGIVLVITKVKCIMIISKIL